MATPSRPPFSGRWTSTSSKSLSTPPKRAAKARPTPPESDKFDDPNLPGELQVTVTFKKVSVGTELNVVQEGVPEVIPPEACYLGWQESLTLLAKLVEADIPD